MSENVDNGEWMKCIKYMEFIDKNRNFAYSLWWKFLEGGYEIG